MKTMIALFSFISLSTTAFAGTFQNVECLKAQFEKEYAKIETEQNLFLAKSQSAKAFASERAIYTTAYLESLSKGQELEDYWQLVVKGDFEADLVDALVPDLAKACE